MYCKVTVAGMRSQVVPRYCCASRMNPARISWGTASQSALSWMGFGERKNVNNWNPWINSNWLAAALLLEADPGRRTRSVYKIMRSLDNFINIYPDDGASDEGPGYWGRAGASLFDNLELLGSATNGTIDIYRAPLVRSMGQYIY